MNIEMRKGVCKYCGQIGMVEAPELDQDAIDNLVSQKCFCEDAKLMREEEDRKQQVRMYVDSAKKGIVALFEDWKEAERLFLNMAEPIATGTISSISIKMADSDVKASMSRKPSGALKVSRKDAITREIS